MARPRKLDFTDRLAQLQKEEAEYLAQKREEKQSLRAEHRAAVAELAEAHGLLKVSMEVLATEFAAIAERLAGKEKPARTPRRSHAAADRDEPEITPVVPPAAQADGMSAH